MSNEKIPEHIEERLLKNYANTTYFSKAESGLKHFYEVMNARKFGRLVTLEMSGY